MEEVSRAVRHLFDDLLVGEDALLCHPQHRYQRMLHERAAGGRLQATSFLLSREVRGVVGGHDVYLVVIYCLAQSFPVGGSLDGRVPLDAVAEAGVVIVGEPEMVDAHFAGDLLLGKGKIAVKERCLLR